MGGIRRERCWNGPLETPKSHLARGIFPDVVRGVWSGGFAMAGFQQFAQTFDADDLTLVSFMLRLDDPIEALVNSLMMIV